MHVAKCASNFSRERLSESGISPQGFQEIKGCLQTRTRRLQSSKMPGRAGKTSPENEGLWY